MATATATSESPAIETLQEYATSAGVSLRVDRDKGIIHGVKILGLASLNGRTYTPQAAAGAMKLYEGARCNVDHGKQGESRSYADRVGAIRNVSATADGLYGDFHFNPKHALAEQICWDAEHAPGNLGFSHDAEARTSRQNGKVVVEEIKKVTSVDLVANPATTRGLFESEDPALTATPELREFSEHALSAITDARSIVLDSAIDLDTKKSRLTEVLAGWQDELTEAGTSHSSEKGKNTMEFKDLTIESLQENRKDLVEKLTGTDATSKLNKEIATLKESVAAKIADIKALDDELIAFRAKEAEAIKLTAITEELKIAKLDRNDKVAVSEAFLGQLKTAPDAAARKALIQDRMTLVGRVQESVRPITGASPYAPVVEDVRSGGRDSLSAIFK